MSVTETVTGGEWLGDLSVEWLGNAALTLHGPVDIATTLIAKRVCTAHSEGNPVVNEMDTGTWLLVKLVALGGLWAILKTWPGAAWLRLPLLSLVALGLLLIVPNVGVIAMCLL